MNLKLVRDIFTSDETLGKLYIDNKFFCYTLEDAMRDKKVFSVTAIPYGTYTIAVTYSEHFKTRLPLLYNNPRLTVKNDLDEWCGVRMHGGNTELDTEGCILVAANRYINTKSTFITKAKQVIMNWIQGSKASALSKLLDNGHRHVLQITK